MRRGLLASLLILSAVGAAGCGESNDDDGEGFSERDLRAASHFSRIKAQSPSLEGLAGALDPRTPERMRRTLRRLRSSAKRYKGVISEFEDPRARRAMREFVYANSDVVSSYGRVVDFIVRKRNSLRKAYVLVRELNAAVDATNAADRRLTNLEPAG